MVFQTKFLHPILSLLKINKYLVPKNVCYVAIKIATAYIIAIEKCKQARAKLCQAKLSLS